MKMTISSVEGLKKIKPGKVVLFDGDYLSGVAVVVDRNRWLKMAGVEYPKHMLEEIRKGKEGVVAVIIGELMGSFMDGRMYSNLPQSERQRRFVFIDTRPFMRNKLFLCSNARMIESIFNLRVFAKEGTNYIKTLRYDLLVLNGFLMGQKGDDFSDYGNKLFDIFKKCIPR